MLDKGTKNFIELDQEKCYLVLKRIEKNTNVKSVNTESDIKELINNV